MFNKLIDLHTHTTSSDGTCTPEELVVLAKKTGLSAIAITDHDTVGGLKEGIEIGKKCGVEVLPGIEISAQPEKGTLHILGYGFDPNNIKLRQTLEKLVSSRNQRNQRLIEKCQSKGVDITLEEVKAIAKEGNVGRPHFAKVFIDKGYAKNIQEVFDIYLGKGGKCYLDKDRLSLEESIDLIQQGGGIAVLAHPYSLRFEEKDFRKYLITLKDKGLQGIEVFYPEHSSKETIFFEKMALEMELIFTGGSDFHGANKPNIFLGKGRGDMEVSYKYFQILKERINYASQQEQAARY